MPPDFVIIILVDYLISFQWSNGEEVAWLVLPAAWRPNLSSEIIATEPRVTLVGACNILLADYLQIRAIDLIPKGTGVVPPPLVQLVLGCVKDLRHI